MKKKKIYIIATVAIVVLFLYFSYYLLFLEDEYQKFLIEYGLELDNNSSIQLTVSDVGEDGLTYCILNDCSYSLPLSSKNLLQNDFDGWGEYRVTIEVSKYLLYPWGSKKCIKSWSLEKINSAQAVPNSKELLTSIKVLLNNYYVWEVYSIPTVPNPTREDNASYQEKPNLNFDYTKSLYLIHQIAQEKKDQELDDVFDKEISYLNENREDIMENYEDYIIPSAYILKLVDQGLDQEYLSIFEESTVPTYYEESLEKSVEEKTPVSIVESSPQSIKYQNLIQYADYFNIYTEYDMEEFADYSYNQMIVLFNNMESLNGVCTLAYSNQGLIDSNDLKRTLEDIFSNETTQLIEGSLYELVMCKKYSEMKGVEIGGLDKALDTVLYISTSNIEEYSFVMRGVSTSGNNIEELLTIRNFSLLDNLMYIWSEE